MASFRCKGKFIKESEFRRRQKVSEIAKTRGDRSRFQKQEAAEKREPVRSMGRRIVDLAAIANRMWCDLCDIPLSFRNLEKEVQRGLGSVFHVRCIQCLDLFDIPSSTTTKRDNSAYQTFAVNTAAAAGCMVAGISHRQFNRLLSSMDIPVVSRSILKRAERKVVKGFEKENFQSELDALLREDCLTASSESCASAPAASAPAASAPAADVIVGDEDDPVPPLADR